MNTEITEEVPAAKRGLLPCYSHIPDVPTQMAFDNIRFDFNAGIRVLLPDNGVAYHCLIMDRDENLVLHDDVMTEHRFVASKRKYFINFHLEITNLETQQKFVCDYDAKDKTVMLFMPCPAIGDTVAWFSYAERFQKKLGCKLVCVMNPRMADIFRGQYPDITFISEEQAAEYAKDAYANYCVGLFYGDDEFNFSPVDYRTVGLHHTAAAILRLPFEDAAPRVDLSAERRIKQPYVCISAKASSQAKFWNNPWGWETVIQYLKNKGYRVLCIDREKDEDYGFIRNRLPDSAEDFTGDFSLQERINLIKDADFFIGLSSGLTWLAWCCRVPVILISGFTREFNEFSTPYRIINYHTCNGCWNDSKIDYQNGEVFYCPRKKNIKEFFECTSLIAPERVISAIDSVIANEKNLTLKEKSFRKDETAEQVNKSLDGYLNECSAALNSGAKNGALIMLAHFADSLACLKYGEESSLKNFQAFAEEYLNGYPAEELYSLLHDCKTAYSPDGKFFVFADGSEKQHLKAENGKIIICLKKFLNDLYNAKYSFMENVCKNGGSR